MTDSDIPDNGSCNQLILQKRQQW